MRNQLALAQGRSSGAPRHSGAHASRALADLGLLLAGRGYRFTSITPATQQTVNARSGNQEARDLEDVFGWNRPFVPELLPPNIFAAGLSAGVFEIGSRFARSAVRFSSLGDALVVHSGFPTTRRDAVFFGPDTYRFVRTLKRDLPMGKSLIELGCGTGAAAIAVASRYERVILTDINPLAVQYAQVNAQINAGIVRPARLEFLSGDLFAEAEGPFDAIIANPPFMIDPKRRLYRDGGPRGFELALRILRESLPRLSSRGRLLLYTGIPYVRGQSPFHDELRVLLASRSFSCEEIDVDVFGEELASAAYAEIDRLAVIALTVDGVQA